MAEEQNIKNRTKHFILFSFIFLVLNFLDSNLTIFALQNGATELNPLINRNINELFQIKAIGAALIISCAYIFMKKQNTNTAILYSNTIMLLVVVWNATQIFLNVII